jgi:hypothetical protein
MLCASGAGWLQAPDRARDGITKCVRPAAVSMVSAPAAAGDAVVWWCAAALVLREWAVGRSWHFHSRGETTRPSPETGGEEDPPGKRGGEKTLFPDSPAAWR